MMVGQKRSLTQSAITSPSGLSRTKKLPLETKETATPTQTILALPEDVEEATEETVFPPNELYITLKLPQEVAILHIYENGTNEYSVWGGNAIDALPQTQPNKPPNLSLGKLVQQGELPENIQDDMSYFSHINLEIRKWLKRLRSKLGEKLCLIIVDHTDFEIPWEMLELSPYDSPNEYLGALITTVRWRQIIKDDEYMVLEFKADQCCGKAVAYVLDTELKGIGPELEILERLQAVVYRSSQHNIREFQTHLQRNDDICSFVYIACHGTFKNNLKEIALGSLSNHQQQLKLMALYRCQLHLVQQSQGIVFINACHSAREQAHSSIPHSYRLGFIELFLRQGARGVIGTLGAVGDSHAAIFARELIEESLHFPNLSVAALLKKLRLKVVKNLPDEPTTKDLLPLIYTFMYVYYGNPMTVLRLSSSGEIGHV
jgi:CHAT domain